jgi:BASS family bile acid:Na+ symporter
MLVAAVIGFIFPQHVATLGKWVPYLLGIVMLGMAPIITALGALKAILKSLGVIVNPIPNITIPSK